jgi:hypothetical protein
MPKQTYTPVPVKDDLSTSEDIASMSPSSSSRLSPSFDDDDDDEKTVVGSGRAEGFEMRALGKSGRITQLEEGEEERDEEKLGMHEVDLDEGVHYTGSEERIVLKKLDRRVVLFVALLYLLSFLDRSSMFSTLSEKSWHELSTDWRQISEMHVLQVSSKIYTSLLNSMNGYSQPFILLISCLSGWPCCK